MRVCQDDPATQGVRDAALIAILRGAGLRRAEAVKLQLKDLALLNRGMKIKI